MRPVNLLAAIQSLSPGAEVTISREPGESEADALAKARWHSGNRPSDEAILGELERQKDAEAKRDVEGEQLLAKEGLSAIWEAVKAAAAEGRAPTDDDLPKKIRDALDTVKGVEGR